MATLRLDAKADIMTFTSLPEAIRALIFSCWPYNYIKY